LEFEEETADFSTRLRSGQKTVAREPLSNSRSLHYSPPDFPLRVVALIKFVRLSSQRVAYVVVPSSCDVGNPGRDDKERVALPWRAVAKSKPFFIASLA
jgi:hypothetical protein